MKLVQQRATWSKQDVKVRDTALRKTQLRLDTAGAEKRKMTKNQWQRDSGTLLGYDGHGAPPASMPWNFLQAPFIPLTMDGTVMQPQIRRSAIQDPGLFNCLKQPFGPKAEPARLKY